MKNTIAASLAVGFSASLFSSEGPVNYKSKKIKLRFALASDGHYAQPGTNYVKEHNNIIKWLNKEFNVHPLDFVIFNGDIVHDQPGLLQEVKSKYFDKLKCPYYATMGNHDLADAKIWTSVFGHDYNYSFEKNNTGFILANTSNTKGEYLCPDINFLQTALEKLKANKIVFIVLHIPPHQWLPENTFYAECPDVINLFTKYPNVKAVFHGHDHARDGVFYSGNELPHFFDAHYGGNWGTEYRGYRIVEVCDDYSIKTFQVNASLSPVISSQSI
ncbi:MAG: metallophosphoesterase [Chitinophagaceae bacterium]|nr:metallophosphoesterase [Chitinophagaceae bacterium]